MGIGLFEKPLLFKGDYKVCPRCRLRYASNLQACFYCSELDDDALRIMQDSNAKYAIANARLGKPLVLIGILLGFLVAIIALNL